jgi:hypothetical protein
MVNVDALINEVLDRGFEIRVERWGWKPSVTITDPNDPRDGGCAALRGEGGGDTYEAALIDACTQAINDKYPQATACGRAVKLIDAVKGPWSSCVLDKVHDGACRDAAGNWGRD